MADKPPAKQPGSFAATLASLRPSSDAELDENLQKLLVAVQETGKAGSITYKIGVKLATPGGSLVIVNDTVTAKFPERARAESTAFITRDGNLSNRDPSSMPLFENPDDIQDANVDPRTGEIKDPHTS